MKTKLYETFVQIAERVPPGDRWVLVGDNDKTVYNSITDTLEAWFKESGIKCEFRLAPLDSKLYAIITNEEVIPEEKPKTYSLYGEFKQGI